MFYFIPDAELFNIVRYNVWDYLHDVIGLDEVHETILASMEQHSRDRRLCIRKCANTVLAVFRQIVDDAVSTKKFYTHSRNYDQRIFLKLYSLCCKFNSK